MQVRRIRETASGNRAGIQQPRAHCPPWSDSPMRRFLALIVVTVTMVAAFPPASARAEFPKPSPYPKSWELEFVHGKPQRVVVQDAQSNAPRAYWYMTYQVTNNTD